MSKDWNGGEEELGGGEGEVYRGGPVERFPGTLEGVGKRSIKEKWSVKVYHT